MYKFSPESGVRTITILYIYIYTISWIDMTLYIPADRLGIYIIYTIYDNYANTNTGIYSEIVRIYQVCHTDGQTVWRYTWSKFPEFFVPCFAWGPDRPDPDIDHSNTGNTGIWYPSIFKKILIYKYIPIFFLLKHFVKERTCPGCL